MQNNLKSLSNEIRRDLIIGSRRFSNYFCGFFLFIGGISFFLAGISSYLKINLLPPFSNPQDLIFIPQGLVMIFYGTLSFSFSMYIIFTIIFDVGGGYNEYNKIENLVKVVRKGFPGENRQVLLTYSFDNISAIGIKITEGLNPTRSIYLCLKDKRNIPLTSVEQPTSITNLEEQAASLAKFLSLKLKNL